MASSEFIQGYWIKADGTCTESRKASWRKYQGKWWYGYATGWYAKSTTYKIDGKKYTFDSNGFLK